MSDYYSAVVGDLLKYREYKQRLIIIAKELDDQLEKGMGIDYTKPSVQTSNYYDSTMQTALKRVDSDLAREFEHKKELVERVEIALKGLDPIERFIIERKYLTGRKDFDVNIYSDFDFGWGKMKYYDIKDEAVAKLARILGYK
jgi:ArpU family phage transcriptional regulator